MNWYITRSWFNCYPLAFAAVLAVVAMVVAAQDARHPVADEFRYLTTAQQLATHRIFAREPAHIGPARPGMEEAPATPFIVAGLMMLDRQFQESIECILTSHHSEPESISLCPADYGPYVPVQTVLLAMAASSVWLIAGYCGASPAVRWVAFGLVLLSEQYTYYVRFFLTKDTFFYSCRFSFRA